MIVLIDNDDSFTYNIVDLLRRCTDVPVRVIRHCDVTEHDMQSASAFIFSPGPSLPADYPVMARVLREYSDKKPILGICLGCQAICSFYGAELYNLSQVYHGVQSSLDFDSSSLLFRGVDSPLLVGRYHSWAVRSVAPPLRITAMSEDGVVMAVEHQSCPVFGVQFHVESYMTSQGETIIKNFIDEIHK